MKRATGRTKEWKTMRAMALVSGLPGMRQSKVARRRLEVVMELTECR
jgi:hypothetical protein